MSPNRSPDKGAESDQVHHGVQTVESIPHLPELAVQQRQHEEAAPVGTTQGVAPVVETPSAEDAPAPLADPATGTTSEAVVESTRRSAAAKKGAKTRTKNARKRGES